jgi:hypothetical protein
LNIDTHQRASLATFAYMEARHTRSLNCMKAVCHVLRNRMRAGWGDGTWYGAMNLHGRVAGNPEAEWAEWEPNDRVFQLLLREIDEIYLGVSEDDTRVVVGKALYYVFIDRPVTEWFEQNIVRDPANHPHRGHIHPMALYE